MQIGASQGMWSNFEIEGGTASESILGGGTRHLFVVTLYNSKLLEGMCPPAPPALQSLQVLPWWPKEAQVEHKVEGQDMH